MFAAAVAVWSVPVLRGGRTVTFVGAMLIAGTIVGPFFFAIDGPIQISIDRVMFAAIIVMLVCRYRLGTMTPPQLTRTDWWLMIAVGYFFVSALRGDAAEGSTPPVARWLFYVAMPAGAYAMIRVTRVTDRDLRTLMNLWIGLSIYLAVTALLEIKGLRGLVFPRYINDPSYVEFFGRGRGPLLNPIGNGVVMGGGLCCAAIRWFNSERIGRIVLTGCGVVIFGGVYATLTRSCWVGAVGGLAMMAMMYAPRWFRIWSAACLALLIVAMSMGLKDQLMSFKRDANLSANEAAKSVELRPLLAIVAYEMWKDRPVFGHGFGQYFVHHKPYHTDRGYGLPLEKVRVYVQHNAFLAVLVDTGLIGLSLMLGFAGMVTAAAVRVVRDPGRTHAGKQVCLLWIGVTVVYVANAMFHDVTVIPMVQMFVVAAAAPVIRAATIDIARETSVGVDRRAVAV